MTFLFFLSPEEVVIFGLSFRIEDTAIAFLTSGKRILRSLCVPILALVLQFADVELKNVLMWNIVKVAWYRAIFSRNSCFKFVRYGARCRMLWVSIPPIAHLFACPKPFMESYQFDIGFLILVV